MNQTLQMTGDIAGGTENDIAALDIPSDGTITGISVSVGVSLDADDQFNTLELSFVSTGQNGVNDARGVLAISRQEAGFVTSGLSVSAVNYHIPMNVPVSGGERLHAHSVGSAGVSGNFTFLIQFEPKAGRVQSRRRSTR